MDPSHIGPPHLSSPIVVTARAGSARPLRPATGPGLVAARSHGSVRFLAWDDDAGSGAKWLQAVAERLGQVFDTDRGGAGKVGDGARDAQDAVVSACR